MKRLWQIIVRAQLQSRHFIPPANYPRAEMIRTPSVFRLTFNSFSSSSPFPSLQIDIEQDAVIIKGFRLFDRAPVSVGPVANKLFLLQIADHTVAKRFFVFYDQ